ncbi:MAG: YihY/virulence factor BrkB family protein [Casimicrobiaceae bacterium]
MNPAQPTAKPLRPPTLRAWSGLARKAVQAWLDDFAPSMGAALSYYMVFSIAPLLVIVISVAGFFFGRDVAQEQLFYELSSMLGTSTAESLKEILAHADDPKRNIWTAAAGIVVMLIGATSVLAELQSALDRIWRSPTPDSLNGVWGFVRTRLLSFSMILGLVFLLMVSLVVSAGLTAAGNWGTSRFEHWGAVLEVGNTIISYFVTALLFGMIYKLLPRGRIGWRDVWVGALVTAALFTLGKFAIAVYIGKAGVADAYGAAGSLVVLLVWVYYSAQIFLLGAEFTWVYAYSLGTRAGQTPPDTPARAP